MEYCITCKNMVSSLKQKPIIDKKGNLKIKGICPVCKQFAKWVPNKENKYYGI